MTLIIYEDEVKRVVAEHIMKQYNLSVQAKDLYTYSQNGEDFAGFSFVLPSKPKTEV